MLSSSSLSILERYFANRAQCFVEQGLYARAEQDLTKALGIDPKDPQLLYKRGIARYAQNNFQEAIDDLTSSLEHGAYPQNLHDIYYHLGVSFANLGKHLFAVPALDEAIKRIKPEVLSSGRVGAKIKRILRPGPGDRGCSSSWSSQMVWKRSKNY